MLFVVFCAPVEGKASPAFLRKVAAVPADGCTNKTPRFPNGLPPSKFGINFNLRPGYFFNPCKQHGKTGIY
jgi:hypothetical protein